MMLKEADVQRWLTEERIASCKHWLQTLPSQENLQNRSLQRLQEVLDLLQTPSSRQQRQKIHKLLGNWDVRTKTQGRKRKYDEIKVDLVAKIVEEARRLKRMRHEFEEPCARRAFLKVIREYNAALKPVKEKLMKLKKKRTKEAKNPTMAKTAQKPSTTNMATARPKTTKFRQCSAMKATPAMKATLASRNREKLTAVEMMILRCATQAKLTKEQWDEVLQKVGVSFG